MRTKNIQAKHVDKLPILKFLNGLNGWGCIFNTGAGEERDELFENSVWHAIPQEVPYKVGLAAMANLIKRGLVSGCACGCRGDFELTVKGRELLKLHEPQKIEVIFNHNWSTGNE